MNLLNRDYFIRNKELVLLGAVCGVSVAALFGLGSRSVAFLFAWMVAAPFINCPHTLRTQAGRLWWRSYGVLFFSLVVIHLVRLPHPLAWASLILCLVCGILTVCLRWNPPTGGV